MAVVRVYCGGMIATRTTSRPFHSRFGVANQLASGAAEAGCGPRSVEGGARVSAQYHARMVREKAALRALGVVAGEIATRSFEPIPDVASFIDESEQAVFRVTEQKAARNFRPVSAL